MKTMLKWHDENTIANMNKMFKIPYNNLNKAFPTLRNQFIKSTLMRMNNNYNVYKKYILIKQCKMW